MLPRRLPSMAPLTCDECHGATLTLKATTFERAWTEVDEVGWFLFGGRGGRWRLLCPKCRPRGKPGGFGPSAGTL